MNATINNGLRALALVILVIAAAAAGLAVGQLMQGVGDATTVGDQGVRDPKDDGSATAAMVGDQGVRDPKDDGSATAAMVGDQGVRDPKDDGSTIAATLGDQGVRDPKDDGSATAAPAFTTLRYWDYISMARRDEPSHPQPGQRKARSSRCRRRSGRGREARPEPPLSRTRPQGPAIRRGALGCADG